MKHWFCIIFLYSCAVLGQRDAAHWYFGNFAGLEFNSGSPQFLEDGALNTTEGCSAISDKDTGELLFYTEGTTIWNRNHEVMLNGTDLLGSLSSTQSAVIVPLPGSATLFYVITTDEVQAYQNTGTGNGINYSIVSITGDAGLGEVIQKNVQLLPEGSEKISVVETADGVNFWIVTHFQNQFYSFLMDATGINPTPVISTIGPTISDYENFRGAMKIAPDGSRIAIAHTLFEPSLDGLAFVYDFDNNTGIVSNQTLLGDDLVYYGVEFSSDSSKLYFSSKTIDTNGLSDRVVIEQYDLTASSIPGSRFVILDQENDLLSDLAGALQIAMDKKIYHSIPGRGVSVINYPKLVGSASGFSGSSVNLGLRTSSFGLPQYIQSFFESFVTIENICEFDTTSFIVDPDANVTGASWDFGDIASGANNFSTQINPTHTFTEPGLFAVTVEFQFSDRVPKTFVEFVEIIPSLDLPQSINFNQCDIDGNNDGITVFNLVSIASSELNVNGLDYFFYNSLQDAQLGQNPITNTSFYQNTTNGESLYMTVGADQSCNNIVEIVLTVFDGDGTNDFSYATCDVLLSKSDVWITMSGLADQILMNYPEDAEVAFYLTLNELAAQSNPLNENTVPHSFTELGFLNVFYQVYEGADCLGVGEVSFDILDGLEDTTKNVNFCVSDGSLTLSPDNAYASYSWSTGENTPTISINQAGTYTVDVVSISGCSGRLQYIVTQIGLFDIEVAVQDFQQNNTVVVTPVGANQELLYSIDGGQTFKENGVFTNLVAGYYTLVVRDYANCNEVVQLVLVRGAPRYFTPNGDGHNDFWHVQNAGAYPGLTVSIMDRYGKNLANLTSSTQGWDGTYGGVSLPTGAYWYLITYEEQSYAGHFTLIRR